MLRWRCSVVASVVMGIESALEPMEALLLLFHGLVGVHLDRFVLGTQGFTPIFDDAPLEILSIFSKPNQ